MHSAYTKRLDLHSTAGAWFRFKTCPNQFFVCYSTVSLLDSASSYSSKSFSICYFYRTRGFFLFFSISTFQSLQSSHPSFLSIHNCVSYSNRPSQRFSNLLFCLFLSALLLKTLLLKGISAIPIPALGFTFHYLSNMFHRMH